MSRNRRKPTYDYTQHPAYKEYERLAYTIGDHRAAMVEFGQALGLAPDVIEEMQRRLPPRPNYDVDPGSPLFRPQPRR